MRSIGHPDYVYEPLSPERRAKMRAASLARLGIPEGHHRLYDVNVPDEFHPAIARLVLKARNKGLSKKGCRAYVRALLDVARSFT